MLIPYSGEVALIKLAGYTLAGAVLRRVHASRLNYFLFGILRFTAGIFVWFVTAIALLAVFPDNPSAGDNISLLVSRLIVWTALIALVFPRGQAQKPVLSNWRFWLVVLAGIAWSYCLDGLVVLLRMLIPGFGTTPWC